MKFRALAFLLLASTLALVPAGSALAESPLRSLLQPGFLGAAVGSPVQAEPLFRTTFKLDRPGPYEVRVSNAGNAVVLSVLRGNPRKRAVLTRYLARGVVAPERLQATFGKLGKLSMHFRESSHRPWVGKQRKCRGKGRYVVRRGVFVGNLRFRGEDDYLTIQAHRAKGSVTALASKCRRRDGGRRPRSSSPFEESLSAFIASDRDGVDSTVFGAISFRSQLFYVAQQEESRGRLGILRAAILRDRGELPLNEAVTAGSFSPEAPFHGTGHYRAAPDGSTSWSGNLSVDFPGARRHPLAGPGYETLLEVGF